MYADNKLYFHSAVEGHKIDALNKHNKVSFCVVDQDQVIPEKLTTYFRSVIAFGRIRQVESPEEKRRIATVLAMKYSADFKEKIPAEIDSSMSRMAILEMEIEHLTGKEAIELVKKGTV